MRSGNAQNPGPATGSVAFSVTNKSGDGCAGRLSVVPSGSSKLEWFTIDGDRERTFASGETQTATIKVSAPKDVAAAQAGDPVALERMLRELEPDIRRYARRQCHRTTAIEDVVQEALIVLYRRLGNVRDPLALAGWIFRVVTRLCMLPVLVLIRGAEELTERHEAEYFAQVPKDELRIDLVRALESLPDMYREVILLRDMEQLTIGEVADRLRITREACKSRIHRGRAFLREYLQGDKPRGGKK